MIIGARTAAWAKSDGWVNPYVMDGLIAMWDGEWNAGGGVHNPNATNWIDVVSGRIAKGIGNPAFSDNAAIGDGGTYFDTETNFNYIQKVTLEVCLNYSEIRHGSPISAAESGAVGIQAADNVFFWAVGNPNGGWFENTSFNINLNETQTLSGIADGFSKVFMNGELFITFLNSGVNGIRWPNKNKFYIGFDYGDYNYESNSFVGKIHCVRVYDRGLSPSEILANYAIDKARFSLP